MKPHQQSAASGIFAQSAVCLLVALSGATLLWPGPLPAQAQNPGGTTLRWQPVPHAARYALEVAPADSQELSEIHTVDSPFIVLELSPGRYRFRLSTIDSQGHQGPWSAWRDLTVEEPKAAESDQGFLLFVPGVLEWRSGYVYRAAGIGGLTALGGLITLDSTLKARAATAAEESDPLYRLYNEPALLLTMGSNPQFDSFALPLLALGIHDYQKRRNDYFTHRRQSRIGGLMFLLGSVLHVSHALGWMAADGQQDHSKMQFSLAGEGLPGAAGTGWNLQVTFSFCL